VLKATIIGNLGNDPDLRYSANGSPLLRFNVAANYRTRTPEGEYQDRAGWVRVTVPGTRAEGLSPYLKKGSRVLCRGAPRSSTLDRPAGSDPGRPRSARRRSPVHEPAPGQ
jgi:single-strand DNA-binding protein